MARHYESGIITRCEVCAGKDTAHILVVDEDHHPLYSQCLSCGKRVSLEDEK